MVFVLVLLPSLFTWVNASASIAQSTRTDFSILSCPKHHNITIFMLYVSFDEAEMFFHYMDELINNEACYTINIYLPIEDGLARWKGRSNDWTKLMVGIKEYWPNLGTDVITTKDEVFAQFVDEVLQKGRSIFLISYSKIRASTILKFRSVTRYRVAQK